MQDNVDFSLLITSFEAMLVEFKVRVKGGVYRLPNSQETKEYHGIIIHADIMKALHEITDQKTSYVALRDAQYLLARIQEVKLDGLFIQAELKGLINSPNLPKAQGRGTVYTTLKCLKEDFDTYLGICKNQHDFLSETLWSMNAINTSINRRFFEGDHMFMNNG